MNIKKSSQFSFPVFLIALCASAIFSPSLAQSQERQENIVIANVPDPETGQLRQVTMPSGTDEELRRASPEVLRQQVDAMMRAQAAQAHSTAVTRQALQCANRHGPLTQVAIEYPMEALGFNIALALSAETKLRSDPAAIRHWYEQSIVDPVAHASFAAFMLANRATMSMFSMIGLAADPCRAFMRAQKAAGAAGTAAITAEQLRAMQTPTRTQRIFQPLLGPFGMSSGLLASSMVHEVISDRDLQLCALGLVQTVPKAERDAACDRAYAEWVTTRKITKFAPDMISMTLTSFIQAYAINMPLMRATHAIRTGVAGANAAQRGVAPFLLKSVKVIFNVGSYGMPVIRFGMTIANIVIFLEINEYLLHPVKYWWERRYHGETIANGIDELIKDLDRTERAQWAWSPVPCPVIDTSLGHTEMAQTATTGGWMPMDAEFCTNSVRPGQALTKIGEKFKQWRDFALADAYTAKQNWQDYVLKFTNMYTNAEKFYTAVMGSVRWQRERPTAIPDGLYLNTPFIGLTPYTFGATPQIIRKACDLDATSKAKLRAAISVAEDEIDKRVRNPSLDREREGLTELRIILAGLQAINCEIPLNADEQIATASAGTPLTDAAREQITENIRVTRYHLAIRTLNRILQDIESYYKDDGIRPGTPDYQRWGAEISRQNPFARIRFNLGNPEVMGAGEAWVRSFNTNEEVINQDHRGIHPTSIGRAYTPEMTDYLIASMVCGPEANPSHEVKVQLYRERNRSFFNVFQWLGVEQPRRYFEFNPNASSTDPEDAAETHRVFLDNHREAVETHRVARENQRVAELVAIEQAFRDEQSPAPRLLDLSSRTVNVAMMPRVWGSRAFFNPPKVVGDLGSNICDQVTWRNDRSGFVANAGYTVGSETNLSLLDIVKAKTRDDIVRGGGINSWWAENVERHVVAAVRIFKEDYRRLLTEKFLPRMRSERYVTYNDRRFAEGVSRSVLDEVRLNLLMITKTYRATRGAQREIGVRLEQISQAFSEEMRATSPLILPREAARMQNIIQMVTPPRPGQLLLNQGSVRERVRTIEVVPPMNRPAARPANRTAQQSGTRAAQRPAAQTPRATAPAQPRPAARPAQQPAQRAVQQPAAQPARPTSQAQPQRRDIDRRPQAETSAPVVTAPATPPARVAPAPTGTNVPAGTQDTRFRVAAQTRQEMARRRTQMANEQANQAAQARAEADRVGAETPVLYQKTTQIAHLFQLMTDLFATEQKMRSAVLEIETGLNEAARAAETEQARFASASNLQLSNPRVKAAFEKNKEALEIAIEELEVIVSIENDEAAISQEAKATLKELREAALANLNNLVTEIGGYFGIVNSIELSPGN